MNPVAARRRPARHVVALTLLLGAAGCSSYREAPLRDWGEVGPAEGAARAGNAALAAGDRVRLRLRGGCVLEGRLTRTGADSLVVAVTRELPLRDAEFGRPADPAPCHPAVAGGAVTVAVADVLVAERLRASLGRSLLLGLGLVPALILMFLVLTFDHSSWPG